jgi:hypothetical protein
VVITFWVSKTWLTLNETLMLMGVEVARHQLMILKNIFVFSMSTILTFMSS